MNRTNPPRRPTKRAGNYYVRLAGYISGGCLGAYLVFALLAKIARPYQAGYYVERDIRSVRKELKQQNEINAELDRRLSYLKTPEGAETEARRNGFSRPGETVYLLHRDDPSATPDAAAAVH